MSRLLALLGCLLAGSAHAHEFDPHVIQILPTDAMHARIRWTAPVPTDATLVVPPDCTLTEAGRSDRVRWSELSCEHSRLSGMTLGVQDLPPTPSPVVVELLRDGGAPWQRVIDGEGHPLTLPGENASPPLLQLGLEYGWLGVEHLLLGPDHLLFVIGLVGAVRLRHRLFAAVSAFTVGHALTLGLAATGCLRLPQAPVELCIALSLVWLAREWARPPDEPGPAWHLMLTTGSIGLLHGLGFAGALADIGLPPLQLPLALGAFNLGIELAQVGIIGVCLGLFAALHRVAPGRGLARFLPYAMGSLAFAWVLARAFTLFA